MTIDRGDGETTRIAVCGKGGVGKTSITALMIRHLSKRGNLKILAVDADPAVGLAMALDVKVKKTVNDIRNDVIAKAQGGEKLSTPAMMNLLDYELLDALSEGPNFAFLAIGRPETEGCFCRVNDLLKGVIETLSGNFDVVIIDGEAGVEQVNRRVMKQIDHLILVTDTSAKGLHVTETIRSLALEQGAVGARRVGLIVNRARSGEEVAALMERTTLELLGWIPEDDHIREQDLRGRSFLDLPDASPGSAGVAHVVAALGI